MNMAVAFMVGSLAYPMRLTRTMLADTIHPFQSATARCTAPVCITLGADDTAGERG